jgi:hypothetical protein
MSKINITSGKVLKGDKVEINWKELSAIENKPANCSKESLAPPSPDLTKALAKLICHAILIGEFMPPVKKLTDISDEVLANYHVSGFSMGKDDTGVVITAQRTLKTGRTLGFNTPFTAFDDDSENAYPFRDDLKKEINKCRSEFELYLGGKFKDDGQLKMYDEKD